VTIFNRRADDDGAADLATMLLADIKAIFEERNVDRLRSTALAALLTEFEERPWPEWRQGKPITAPQVARLLRRFGIRPGPIRMKDGEITKGYRLEHFMDAWGRYLPPAAPPPPPPPPRRVLRNGYTVTTRRKPWVPAILKRLRLRRM
jgi:hypothetical protein